MENNENFDTNNKTIQSKLNETVAKLAETRAKLSTMEIKYQQLYVNWINATKTNNQLLQQLSEQKKKRIGGFEAYRATARHFGENFKKYFNDMLSEMPNDEMNPPKSTTISTASVSVNRETPVNILFTQTQMLHSQQQPNPIAQLIEHG